ncbi:MULTISPECIES: HNH endonuclease [Brachymonas]|uniref:HNH endonuclease n=1 Tax=Brachymonas TaxID=28219 RepID=UPI002E7A544C|nr:HNH endonuclease [Brachymonas sp. J145]MEE1652828.1 HNH endonuclease [Brachymonas sp. J145]
MSTVIDFPDSGNWTEAQTQLAFYFYCQTPFGQLHQRNLKVIEMAAWIGRTPSALAMKCCNFASLDPAMAARGVSGLGNAGKLVQKVWNDFHANWDALADLCEAHLTALRETKGLPLREDPADALVVSEDFTGDVRLTMVAQRRKQSFFRQTVLSGYRYRCCISAVSEPRLLVASHIVPWREDASIRLHPGNGLCLSALHDRAFDQYLFSLTDDCRVVLSKQMRQTSDVFLQQTFWPIEDKQIELPERFEPEQAFIRRHREQMRVSG